MAIQDIDPQYLHETARYQQMATLEAYFDGSQYDRRGDLRPWHDDSVPMRERKPSIVYPLPRSAVSQAVSFAVGEGKFPTLSVEVDEEPIAPQLAIDGEQAELLSEAIADLVSRSGLKTAVRDAMRRGCSARTACLVMSLRDGVFSFELPSAKDCLPRFVDGNARRGVAAMTWSYRYDEIEADDQGKPVCKCYQFRRDFDAVNVIDFEPAEVLPGQPVKWTVAKVEAHGFGFCPVVWVRNLDHSPSGLDGTSLYDGLLDEFDALNRSLSQRHHGLEILGVPQPYELGVDNGDGPGPAGRTAAPMPTEPRAAGKPDSLGSVKGSAPARKTGAHHLWSYKGSDVELGLLETTGKAFEVSTKHVADIRSRLLEAMSIILLDASEVAGKGDLSAKALSLMYAPMLALVDELRECWWQWCIKPIVESMLRVVGMLPVGSVIVCGAAEVQALMAKRNVALVDGATSWFPPSITPLWGDYFAPSADESKLHVEAAAAALEKGLVSQETATRYIASTFSIERVEDEIEDIAEEKAEAAKAAADAMASQSVTSQPEAMGADTEDEAPAEAGNTGNMPADRS